MAEKIENISDCEKIGQLFYIRDEITARKNAERCANLAEYHLKGAENLLESSTPLLAILNCYTAMELKVQELLFFYKIKVINHKCMRLALRQIVKRADLSDKLKIAFEGRQEIAYYADINKRDTDRAFGFFKFGKEFIEEIDKLIEKFK